MVPSNHAALGELVQWKNSGFQTRGQGIDTSTPRQLVLQRLYSSEGWVALESDCSANGQRFPI